MGGGGASDPVRVLAIFGSESGTAKAAIKGLASSLGKDGDVQIVDIKEGNSVGALETLKEKYDFLLIATSSFGEGDPPDNYAGFLAKLLRGAKGAEYPLTGMQQCAGAQPPRRPPPPRFVSCPDCAGTAHSACAAPAAPRCAALAPPWPEPLVVSSPSRHAASPCAQRRAWAWLVLLRHLPERAAAERQDAGRVRVAPHRAEVRARRQRTGG